MLELPPRPLDAAGPELIRTAGLTRHFRIGGPFSGRFLHAVDDVDLVIREDEIVALVGESGSGKSTIARLIARVYKPTRGDIFFMGRNVNALRGRRELLEYRSDVPMVFQDPYSSINPAYRATHGIQRTLKLHQPGLSREQMRLEVERVLAAVGLTPPRDVMRKFPHELSGGQRQRLGFAQALAMRPRLILADEPVSMLDVSIRAGLLNVMADMRAREGVSILYITHDIASARYVADRLVVMYAGHVVEQGPAEAVLRHPKHPYTQLLLAAVPDPHARAAPATPADVGEPPRVVDPGEGCRFRWRCRYAVDICATTTPQLRPVRSAQEAACHVSEAEPGASPSAPARAAASGAPLDSSASG